MHGRVGYKSNDKFKKIKLVISDTILTEFMTFLRLITLQMKQTKKARIQYLPQNLNLG